MSILALLVGCIVMFALHEQMIRIKYKGADTGQCSVFGHKFEESCHPIDGLTVSIETPHYDGIGRAHRHIIARCEVCKRGIVIGKAIDNLLPYRGDDDGRR